MVGSIAYYAMAADLAWNVIGQVDQPQNGNRQIFFAKYVYWVVSFPIVSIALGLVSGVSWATIFYNVTLSWTWLVSRAPRSLGCLPSQLTPLSRVLAYLFTAYTSTTYKWGFYAFGTVAYLLLAFSTFFEGRRSLAARDFGVVGGHYTALAGWVNLLWLNYPIAFGISDGGNVIGVTGSFIYFGILDVLMVPLLAVSFMFLARKWDYGRMNLAFTQYGRVRTAPYHEKSIAAPAGGPVAGSRPGTAVV